MVRTGVNNIGKTGHHERNKVEGEGAVSASGAETTSGGGEGMTDDFDPDTPSATDLGRGRSGPLMRGAMAQTATHAPEESSFAPGGDKTSNPDVDAEAMLRQTADREAASRH